MPGLFIKRSSVGLINAATHAPTRSNFQPERVRFRDLGVPFADDGCDQPGESEIEARVIDTRTERIVAR